MVEPILAAGSTWFTQGGTTVKRASITEIEIKDSYTPAGAVTASWDASAAKDGSVMAYVEGTKLIIAGNGSGKVFANPDSSWVFSDSAKKDYYTKLTKITGGNLLDTSKATTMENMFRQSTITSIDTSSWDTSKVESLYCMFYGCMSLTTLDVSNWDTSSVTDMTAMFNMRNANPNTKLVTLDVSNWDVSKVTSMQNMFNNCEGLTSIGDTTNWNTESCTNMQAMFSGCKSMENLNASNWDVSKVTSMWSMFTYCESLVSIGDTTNWNTESCTNMQAMFSGCKSMENLNASNWNTESCTNMSYMFDSCTSLEELNVSNWDVSKVTTFHAMFQGGEHGNPPMIIKELDVSKWDTSSATDMSFMFYGCNGPQTLDVSNWDVSKVTTFDHMFAHSHLTLTGVDNWAPSTACTNMNAMFHSTQNTSIDVSKFNTSKVQFFSQMFEYASKLTEIVGLENWDTSSGLGFEEMFQSCSSLKQLNLSSFDTTKAKDGVLGSTNGHTTATMQGMFNGMSRLGKITLGEKFTFQGDGTTTDPSHYAVLPTPSASYIPGADGLWHTTDGKSFSPQDVPSNTAAVYYAVIVSPVTRSPAAIMLGFFVGAAIRRMRGKEKTPVGYLYGHVAKEGETPTHTIDGVGYVGVVAPDIDTVWTDKEAYPVAVIHDYGGDSPIASLTLCGCDYDGDVPVPRVNTDGSPRSIMTYDYDSFPWQLFHLYSMENGWVLDVSGRDDAPSLWSELIWSNVDCEYVGEPYAYLPSGKVCLAASDPIPVYE